MEIALWKETPYKDTFFSSLIQGGEGELSLQTRALFMLGKSCTDVQVCIYTLPHNTPTFSIAWFLGEEKVPFFYTQVISSPHTKAWNCTWYIVLIVPNIKLLHISYLYSKKTEVQHLNTATYLQQPPLVPAHIRPPTGLAKSSPAAFFCLHIFLLYFLQQNICILLLRHPVLSSHVLLIFFPLQLTFRLGFQYHSIHSYTSITSSSLVRDHQLWTILF